MLALVRVRARVRVKVRVTVRVRVRARVSQLTLCWLPQLVTYDRNIIVILSNMLRLSWECELTIK